MAETIKETRPAVNLSVIGAALVLGALQGLVMHARDGQERIEAWVDCALPAGALAGYAEADDAVRKALFETCTRPDKVSVREDKLVIRVNDWADEDGRDVRTISAELKWRPAKVGFLRWSRFDRGHTYAVSTGSRADG